MSKRGLTRPRNVEAGSRGKNQHRRLDILWNRQYRKTKGNGTGVLIHKSIQVESWHFISSRLTAVRIQHGEKHIILSSAYAPVQAGGVCSARTNQFYEQLTATVKEAKGKGDVVIIWGDMNASIKAENVPGLIGKWASNRVSAHSEGLVNFMMEHQKWRRSTRTSRHNGEDGTLGPEGFKDDDRLLFGTGAYDQRALWT